MMKNKNENEESAGKCKIEKNINTKIVFSSIKLVS